VVGAKVRDDPSRICNRRHTIESESVARRLCDDCTITRA